MLLRRRKSQAIQLLDCRVGTNIPPNNNTPVILSEAKNFMKKEILRTNVLRMTGITPIAKKTVKDLVTSKRVAFTLAEVFSPHCTSHRKIAFTLAEVLITLGIIGVVAAMTIPSVIQNFKVKQTVSQLKKVYSNLSQAFILAKEEFGSPEYWGMKNMYDEESHRILASNISKYMKSVVDCTNTSNTKACRAINNNMDNITMGRSIILADGTYIYFRNWFSNCNQPYASSRSYDTCGQIVVDLNSNKGPNKKGEDKFSFYVTKQAIIPFGTKDSSFKFEKACNKSIPIPYPSFSEGNMYSCTAWVIYNENMDYLKCDDLSWDGKKTCK